MYNQLSVEWRVCEEEIELVNLCFI